VCVPVRIPNHAVHKAPRHWKLRVCLPFLRTQFAALVGRGSALSTVLLLSACAGSSFDSSLYHETPMVRCYTSEGSPYYHDFTGACLASDTTVTEQEYQDRYHQGVSPPGAAADNRDVSSTAIPLQREGGVFFVPVAINGTIILSFLVDSGATVVTIPAAVVLTLMRTGTITANDFLQKRTYTLADGSPVPSQTFRIRTLMVGDKIVTNVIGSVAPVQGPPLLGQSFLSRFKSWRIDNGRRALILE
jgi:predicted aspartyl protease